MADIQRVFHWVEGDNCEEDDGHNFYYTCKEIGGMVCQGNGWYGYVGRYIFTGTTPEEAIAKLEEARVALIAKRHERDGQILERHRAFKEAKGEAQ